MAITRVEPVRVQVRTDWLTGRPREIRWGERIFPITNIAAVRRETAAYPVEVGPSTIFEVDTLGARLALTFRHRGRRWTVDGVERRSAERHSRRHAGAVTVGGGHCRRPIPVSTAVASADRAATTVRAWRRGPSPSASRVVPRSRSAHPSGPGRVSPVRHPPRARPPDTLVDRWPSASRRVGGASGGRAAVRADYNPGMAESPAPSFGSLTLDAFVERARLVGADSRRWQRCRGRGGPRGRPRCDGRGTLDGSADVCAVCGHARARRWRGSCARRAPP